MKTKQSTARAQPVSTRMTRLFCVLTASLFAWSLALPAFAQNGSEQSNTDRNTSENWVLKAGDQSVSKTEFNRMLEIRKKRAQKIRSKAKSKGKNMPEVNEERLRQQVKEQLIDQLVLQHHASTSDVQVTNDELDSKWSEFVNQRFGSEEKLQSKLEQQDETAQGLRQKLKEQLLVQKYIEQNTDVKVTDEEARSWYEQNKKKVGDRSFEDIREPVKKMLKQKKVGQKRKELASKLKDKTDVKMNF